MKHLSYLITELRQDLMLRKYQLKARNIKVILQGILSGGLSTVDLLIKAACFVKKTNNNFSIKRS